MVPNHQWCYLLNPCYKSIKLSINCLCPFCADFNQSMSWDVINSFKLLKYFICNMYQWEDEQYFFENIFLVLITNVAQQGHFVCYVCTFVQLQSKYEDMQMLYNNCSLILTDKPSIRFLTVLFDKVNKKRSMAAFFADQSRSHNFYSS